MTVVDERVAMSCECAQQQRTQEAERGTHVARVCVWVCEVVVSRWSLGTDTSNTVVLHALLEPRQRILVVVRIAARAREIDRCRL